jgi:hypothetical protein
MNKRRRISKLSSDWKFVQNAGGRANLEVTPKEEFKSAYLNSRKNSGKYKNTMKKNLIMKMHTKKLENHVFKLYIGKIEIHLREIMKNDSILAKERSDAETKLKSVKNFVKRSAKL